jgi:cell division septal protein FtsQ
MNRKYSSKKLAEKRKKKRKIKSILFSILTLILVVLFIWFFNSEKIRVKEIVVSGNKYSDQEKIVSDINSVLSEKYFFIFNKSNLFFYPRHKILEKVKNNHVIIKEIEIEITDWDNLAIKIVEHEPVAYYCKNQNECYLININGLVFDQELILPDDLVQVSGLLDENTNLIGQTYVEREKFENIINLIYLLDENDFKTTRVYSKDYETFSIYLENGPYLLIENNSNIQEVVSNLKTVINQDGINAIQFKNLEYVDLRFGNKVYYKIR